MEPGPDGHIFAVDSENHRIQVLTKSGQYVRTIGVTGQKGSGNHQFGTPNAVAVEPGPDGCLYVVDEKNQRLLVFLKG